MDAVVKEEEDSTNDERDMIEPKEEISEESYELIEPKVELFDEMDVKMEELDEDEYRHTIPYEYRDYLEKHTEEEEQPTGSERKPDEQESPFKKKAAECQVCRKTIVRASFIKHAATHTNLKRFSCPVDDCDYKAYQHHNVTDHMKYKHKMVKPYAKDVVRKKLSDEEKEQLKRVKKDCFPEVTRPKTNASRKTKAKSTLITEFDTFNCQVCHCPISEPSMWTTLKRRNHAFTHTDIMLYECIEPACDFKTNYFYFFRKHQTSKHGNISGIILEWNYKVPQEKLLAIEKMLIQCFPELKDRLAAKTKQSCKVCHRAMHTKSLTSKDFRRSHALTHTDIMLYKCCQEDCDYKEQDRNSIIDHQKLMHRMSINVMPVIEIEITSEQEMEIKRMMVQCFPEWSNE